MCVNAVKRFQKVLNAEKGMLGVERRSGPVTGGLSIVKEYNAFVLWPRTSMHFCFQPPTFGNLPAATRKLRKTN